MDNMDDRAFLGYNKKKGKTTMVSTGRTILERKTKETRSTPFTYGSVGVSKAGAFWGRAKCGNFKVGFYNVRTEQEALSHLRAAEQLVQQFYLERTL